ncbi:MAG TPA: hypothetical protein VMZ29_01175 [Candidatus Bathyarchaeia archaeon]|nr:hypothetical protein [Candidatus Bathyarchaeia archaeon]
MKLKKIGNISLILFLIVLIGSLTLGITGEAKSKETLYFEFEAGITGQSYFIAWTDDEGITHIRAEQFSTIITEDCLLQGDFVAVVNTQIDLAIFCGSSLTHQIFEGTYDGEAVGYTAIIQVQVRYGIANGILVGHGTGAWEGCQIRGTSYGNIFTNEAIATLTVYL